MTYFALTLWVWQQTQSATAIALILIFYQLPQMAIALFSGMAIDRISRKRLLALSDTGAACCTISVGILAAFGILQLWHIYVIAAVIGCFGNIHSLTYSTLIPSIVPQQHHARASSMGAIVGYGAGIFSPALAGVLYPSIGLLGITAIDMTTFAIAMLTLLFIQIPPIAKQEREAKIETNKPNVWHNITFGFRYIASQPSLLATMIAMSAFSFLNQIGETLYQPMILARTGGDTEILGTVVAASGIGGVMGAIAVSVWGGFRRRIFGVLAGFIGTGVSKLLLGLGHLPAVWVAGRFASSLHNPLIMSSYMAIWYAKVAPDRQGRVFAADYIVGIAIESSAGLSAGLLADRVFEPAMRSGGWLAVHLGAIVGTGTGSGMAVLYAINATGILLVGAAGFAIRRLRDVEAIAIDR